MGKTEKELLMEISKKFDKLIGITAIQGKDEKKQSIILRSLDFTVKEISQLMGVPEGTIKTWGHKQRHK